MRPINISTLPTSRCLYNTAQRLSSCLSLYLLDCYTEVHSDTLNELGGRRGEDVFPNHGITHLSPCLFLHWYNSNLGTNLCVVVAKIDELPDWESARLHSRGKQQKPGFTEQTSTMKGSMCEVLISPPSSAPPELKTRSPRHSLPPLLHSSPQI